MPYAVVRSGRGYKVQNEKSGRFYSYLPLSKDKAERQRRALYASENGYTLRSRSAKSSPYNVRREKVKANSRRKSVVGGKKLSGGFSRGLFGGSRLSTGLSGGRKYKCNM